jgi:hypothetical protein
MNLLLNWGNAKHSDPPSGKVNSRSVIFAKSVRQTAPKLHLQPRMKEGVKARTTD